MEHLQNQFRLSTDDEIIQKILRGEDALFEVLIRRYNTDLYRIARSYGFNHQDAEDLIQETHIAAYAHLAKFEGGATYKTWISWMLINKCYYKLKYGYLRHEVHGAHMTDQSYRPIYSKENEFQTAEILLNRELSGILEQSIQRIPLIYRTVFVLREVEGCSVAETADILNISSNNVKVRLNRAKAFLQTELQALCARVELYSFDLFYCNAIVERVFHRISLMQANKN